MNLDFLNQIEARLPEFSKAQKRIAHYILEHYEKAAFMTASKLGSTVWSQRIDRGSFCLRSRL